jgi:hypothetical protein
MLGPWAGSTVGFVTGRRENAPELGITEVIAVLLIPPVQALYSMLIRLGVARIVQ